MYGLPVSKHIICGFDSDPATFMKMKVAPPFIITLKNSLLVFVSTGEAYRTAPNIKWSTLNQLRIFRSREKSTDARNVDSAKNFADVDKFDLFSNRNGNHCLFSVKTRKNKRTTVREETR